MSSIKCPQCSMVNWATQPECKRCGLQFRDLAAAASVSVFEGTSANAARDYSDLPQIPTSQSIAYQQNGERQHSHPAYQYQNQTPQNQKSGLAIASMILGILGFVASLFLIGFLLAPIGFVLGIVALVKAHKRPNMYGGKGFAIAGVALSSVIFLFLPIVAAIAIPNLLAARWAANEGSAVSSIRQLASAEEAFMSVKNSDRCGELMELKSMNMIDSVLAGGKKSGYKFETTSDPAGACELHATPISPSEGTRSFYYSTDDGIIRGQMKNGLRAGKGDPEIR